jgi:hypothetical protein
MPEQFDLSVVRRGALSAAYIATATADVLEDVTSLTDPMPITFHRSEPQGGACREHEGGRRRDSITRSQLRAALLEGQELLALVTRALEDDPAARTGVTARILQLLSPPA